MSNTKPLVGLKVVLTGEFATCGRDEATRQLESLGADVTGSVSKKNANGDRRNQTGREQTDRGEEKRDSHP